METEDLKVNEEMKLDKLFEAMSLVQGEVKQPDLDQKVDFLSKKDNRRIKYDYSSLPEVIKCLKEPMKKYGISIIQYAQEISPSKYVLVNVLSHKSGQKMTFSTPMFGLINNDPKLFGTSTTYARRYALCSIFNLCGQFDTDATEIEEEKEKRHPESDDPQGINPTKIMELQEIIKKVPEGALKGIFGYFKIQKIEELSKDKFEEAKKMLISSSQ